MSMRNIERIAWEADQLGMSYGQYVALCENSEPGALAAELRRRGVKMPNYKAFQEQKAKRKLRQAAKKTVRRPTKPFRVKQEHTMTEHVRRCPVCGIRFKTTDHARKYCGMQCALRARSEQHKASKARAREKEAREGC